MGPVSECAGNTDGDKDLSKLLGRTPRVLVAEDNEVNTTVFRRLLTKFGCEVTVVSDGREAIAYALRENFDLMLMDVQMPIAGGVEATAEIRKREKYHHTIIAVTARAGSRDCEECLKAGMDDFISKPFSADQLRRMIYKHLDAMPKVCRRAG